MKPGVECNQVFNAPGVGAKYSCWISTLPLKKKGIILHTDPVSMVFEFSPRECLRQNIFIMIFRGNVLKQHDPSLHTIFEIMVSISIYLDLSWNTWLIESLMQLRLSQWITFGSIWELNKPTKIFLIQIASHVAWLPCILIPLNWVPWISASCCTNKQLYIWY